MKDKIKRIDIKEFREFGFLQELNRQFLHPMGLALEVVKDDNGNEVLGGIWDYRDDPEGIVFDIANSDDERIKRFQENEERVKKHIDKMIASRIESLGFGVEMIPEKINPLIDVNGIKNFEKKLSDFNNHRTEFDILEEFNKIKNPVFDSNETECRLMYENKRIYELLYIEKETNIAFSKTINKSDFRIIDNRVVEIKK